MMKSIGTLAMAAAMTFGVMGKTVRVHAAPAAHAAAGSVKVTVNYTGKGAVDGSHRVWVWLFDSPDIGPGSMPIAETSVDTNGAVAAFEVSQDQVWIAVAYDEKGVMTGNSPPAPGSPIGIHVSGTGAPEAVTAGAAGAVALTFDDSQRMP